MYEAIASAIEKPLKGDVFERGAVELLHGVHYPKLRPVEGGSCAGLDGVGEFPGGDRFFLVSTVGKDTRGNLGGNIRSHLKVGDDRRVVRFATTRAVSGRRRTALRRQLREEFGVRLHDVHDRAAWRRTSTTAGSCVRDAAPQARPSCTASLTARRIKLWRRW